MSLQSQKKGGGSRREGRKECRGFKLYGPHSTKRGGEREEERRRCAATLALFWWLSTKEGGEQQEKVHEQKEKGRAPPLYLFLGERAQSEKRGKQEFTRTDGKGNGEVET